MVKIVNKNQIINFSFHILKIRNCTICSSFCWKQILSLQYSTQESENSWEDDDDDDDDDATIVSKDQRINFSSGC
jgi:hypothetical protein